MSDIKNDGGPAFPTLTSGSHSSGTWLPDMTDGMSLRDWFAGMALQGMLAQGGEASPTDYAMAAFRMADAMLAERNKP